MTEDTPNGVLTPDELEPSDEHVHELDDARRVVHADGGEGIPPDGDPSSRPPGNHRVHERDGRAGTETAPSAYADLADLTGAHALVAGARADDAEDAVVADTDDVSEAFESLVYWYVDLVAGEHRPEAALTVLLENTALDVEVEPR